MRLIAKFDKENLAKKFSFFLTKEGITNSIESEIDTNTNKRTLLIWAEDEDLTEKALKFYQEFIKNPNDSKYNIAFKEIYKKPLIQAIPIKINTQPRKKIISLTFITIAICIFIYLINLFQETAIAKKEGKRAFFITPIQLLLFYDVPVAMIKLSETIKKLPVDKDLKLEDLTPALKEELDEIGNMPQWRGFYSWALRKFQKSPNLISGPMFVKIRQGQIWRLFSPCILHTTLLHLLFNMLWAYLLLKQIEKKMNNFKIILLVVVIGIFSNTCQYLMSGPYFLGFSGVVVGLAGYIWTRKRLAPWEGYAIPNSTFLFLGLFVIGMLLLQVLSFIFQSFGSNFFQYNIANTAHISGAIAGWLLGKCQFFSAGVN
jgi:rhomboid protease GlpG